MTQPLNIETQTLREAFLTDLGVCLNCMSQDDARGELLAFERVGGALVPHKLGAQDVTVEQLLGFEMVIFDGGNSAGDRWKHVFLPALSIDHFINENPLPAATATANPEQQDDVRLSVSLDGGQTYVPAKQGVRVQYAGVLLNEDEETGELLLNLSSEGIIADAWKFGPGEESEPVHVGTSQQTLDDVVAQLR